MATGEITQLLEKWQAGDSSAEQRLHGTDGTNDRGIHYAVTCRSSDAH